MAGGGASVSEVTGNQGQMADVLASGLRVLDLQQTVVFTLYKRVVLPIDGFVFWAKASILAPGTVDPRYSLIIDAEGSLHHTTTNRQDPTESFSVHRMVFTTTQEISHLSDIAPGYLYLATTDKERYAFSNRSSFYKQAGLNHYSGDAVYPSLASQIIDTPEQFLQSQVVSNSLPIWLQLNQLFPVYPSYLIPDNLQPPYAAISIDENSTTTLQSMPYFDSSGTRWQLTKDRVEVTTYGVRNDRILDWIDSVQAFCLNNPQIAGIMNSPIPRDGKRTQVEISAIAQKKVIEFDINYYQSRVNSLAIQLIRSAFITEVLPPAFA